MDKTEPANPPSADNHAAADSNGVEDYLAVHRRALVVDLHADTAQRLLDEPAFDIQRENADGHLDAPRMKTGGLDAQFFSIWVEPAFYGASGKSAIERADKQIAAVRALAEKHPETWVLATSADDVRRAAESGKLAALMGMEGGYALDEKPSNVKKYYDLGVRYLSPAWSVSVSWAGSSNDEIGQTRGLNETGREVIRELNRLGIMVDVSHVSDKTFWDILAVTNKPVIASHSNARALANVPRNLTDEQIRAIADSGGVICVVFYSSFLDDEWSAARKKIEGEIAPLMAEAARQAGDDPVQQNIARDRVRLREYAARIKPLTVARVVDHIDYIVKLIGVEHVGIGSDFDGIPSSPSDLSSVADLPNLTRELLQRDYTPQDVEKILGGNILRVMDAVAIP